MGLPPEEVHLHEVLAWLEEQNVLLQSPGARHVLFYLCMRAWRHERNGEGAAPGDVLRQYASVAAIQRGTGLSRSTVDRALDVLQESGYVIADLVRGHGRSRISIFWSENADQMRADARAGIKPLPSHFQKPEKKPRKVVREGNILQFPNASR